MVMNFKTLNENFKKNFEDSISIQKIDLKILQKY